MRMVFGVNVYIDSEYACKAKEAEGLTLVNTPFFDGKCAVFIEGYRFIPEGERWTDERGTVFSGETAFPWKPYSELDTAQREYERQQYESARAAYDALNEGLTSV